MNVIDGDSVVLELAGVEVECRLIGVDASEMKGADGLPQWYAVEAARFTTNLLTGEVVWVQTDMRCGERDQFDRLLVYLYRIPDGLFVNLEIVRQGYSRAYTRLPYAFRDAFRAYEKTARAMGKGMWNKPGDVERPIASPPRTAPASAPLVSDQAAPRVQPPSAIAVYVTEHGEKYHRAECQFLKKSRIPIDLNDARAKGYTPCSICKPPGV